MNHRPARAAARRAAGRSALAAAVATALVAPIALASATTADAVTRKPGTSKHLKVANGVTLWHRAFVTSNGKPQQATLMQVDLSARGVRVDAGTPANGIGFTRQTVLARAHQLHAVGGINADFFDLHSHTAVPRGGVVRSGVILKTPRPYFSANLYIDQHGKAGIGAVQFVGRVSRGTRGATVVPRAHRIFSVNSIFDAVKGRITYVNSALATGPLPHCTVAYGSTNGRQRVINSIARNVTQWHRRAAGHWALVSCGGIGASWLNDRLIPRDVVSMSMRLTPGPLRTVISGGRILLAHGHPYNDVGGELIPSGSFNPETFVCVSATGRYLLLGTVDGRIRGSGGVTYKQLTSFLLQLHCYSAIVFDGGGSTTLVARTPGHRTAVTQNRPSEGILRPIPDGLYVFAH